MCGIVGVRVFENGEFEVTESHLALMRDAMSHRGPDGAGSWISDDRRIGLGSRRLSIIDLSELADQPMRNEDGSIWITFNGEIYNHADIRAELESSGGHTWTTDHSDTEMILHAFEEWGIDCIQRFRGQFAFAIWDGRSKELWLVRDRLGIKPLYYSVHGGRIVFASEIKALLKDPTQTRSVDEESLFHYLSFLTTPAPATLFEGIRKIPPATWLRITEDGQIREHRYWDVFDHTHPLNGESEDEIAQRVLEELRASVKLRKVSDVPVGVFLSGGIDSSTNTVLFSEVGGWPVRTFSIGYDRDYESYTNEFQYARSVAELVGAEHHELVLTVDDLIDFLPTMIRLQDEPIADPVCVPLFYVSKLARENGVIVCQVGEGADELFCGYPTWKTSLGLQRIDHLPAPRAVKRLGLPALGLVGKEHSFPYEWLRRGVEDLPIFWGGAEAFTETRKRSLLSPRLRRKFSRFSSWEAIRPIRERFEANAWNASSNLSWMTYLDLNLRLPELLLMRVDKMSMGVSLEARVPFLDHKFVELSMSIPESVKIKNGDLKYILKKAVRGLIPDDIIHRQKQGFGVPVHEWLYDKLGDRARDEILGFCAATDLLDQDEVNKVIEHRHGHEVWYLLNLALWWKEYVE